MTLANDLKTLRAGDVLVCRDGTRRTFSGKDPDGSICCEELDDPTLWYSSGRNVDPFKRHWDIVRVIKAKPEKRRADKDADVEWLRYIARHPLITSILYRRLRKIARRLEGGP